MSIEEDIRAFHVEYDQRSVALQAAKSYVQAAAEAAEKVDLRSQTIPRSAVPGQFPVKRSIQRRVIYIWNTAKKARVQEIQDHVAHHRADIRMIEQALDRGNRLNAAIDALKILSKQLSRHR